MVILKIAEPRVLQEYLATGDHGFKFDEAANLIKKFELFYINRLQALSKHQMNKKAEMEA
jgi:hypothetical protein